LERGHCLELAHTVFTALFHLQHVVDLSKPWYCQGYLTLIHSQGAVLLQANTLQIDGSNPLFTVASSSS
jgi:hypothetical protein